MAYSKAAQSRVVLRAAAKSWANGVPWEEALRIAERAEETVKGIKGKGKGKGNGRR